MPRRLSRIGQKNASGRQGRLHFKKLKYTFEYNGAHEKSGGPLRLLKKTGGRESGDAG
jgi:hypothetical protein